VSVPDFVGHWEMDFVRLRVPDFVGHWEMDFVRLPALPA